jgi:hypothetical protein
MSIKHFFFAIICLSPALVLAQAPARSTNPMEALQVQGMQAMMQNMQAIQNCMAGIDQSRLQAIAEQAQETQTQIQQLCEANKGSEARKVAMDFAKQLEKTPELNQMQNCLKDLPDMMKGHIPGTDMAQLQKDYEKEDICALMK